MKKIFICLFLFSACNLHKFEKQVQSRPYLKIGKTYSNEKRIIISGTHHFDIYSRTSSEKNKNAELPANIELQSGGINLLQSYLTILESKYPKQVLNLSFGSSVNKIENIQRRTDSIIKAQASYSSFTENDLLLYQSNKKSFSNSSINNINTNIVILKTNTPLHTDKIKPFFIKVVNGVKVGIMSVSTFSPDTTYSKSIKGIYFEDPVFSVLKSVKKLKRKGAQVLVLLLNAKNDNRDTSSFIKRLPHMGVDIIFTTGLLGRNYIENGIYVMNDKGKGKYLNYVEVIYDTDLKKISKRKTKLSQPVKLCKDFYSITNDCYTAKNIKKNNRIKAIINDNFKLIPAAFLGVKIIN